MNCIKRRSNPSNSDLSKIPTEPEKINQESKTKPLTALQIMNYLYNKHFNERKKTNNIHVDLSQRTVTISRNLPGGDIDNYILPDYKIPDEITNDPKGLILYFLVPPVQLLRVFDKQYIPDRHDLYGGYTRNFISQYDIKTKCE